MPDWMTELPHEADYIRAVKHDGPTELANLCWACARCNDYKGSDVSAYIPGTDQLVKLFNPRSDTWDDHFSWDGAVLQGKAALAAVQAVGVRRLPVLVGTVHHLPAFQRNSSDESDRWSTDFRN
jgi:hypothetical protein